MATTADDGFESFKRGLAHLIESTVESNFHGCCQLDNVAGSLLVNHTMGGKETHHHGMGTTLATHLHFATYLFKLGIGVHKVTRAGTYQHMGAQF